MASRMMQVDFSPSVRSPGSSSSTPLKRKQEIDLTEESPLKKQRTETEQKSSSSNSKQTGETSSNSKQFLASKADKHVMTILTSVLSKKLTFDREGKVPSIGFFDKVKNPSIAIELWPMVFALWTINIRLGLFIETVDPRVLIRFDAKITDARLAAKMPDKDKLEFKNTDLIRYQDDMFFGVKSATKDVTVPLRALIENPQISQTPFMKDPKTLTEFHDLYSRATEETKTGIRVCKAAAGANFEKFAQAMKDSVEADLQPVTLWIVACRLADSEHSCYHKMSINSMIKRKDKKTLSQFQEIWAYLEKGEKFKPQDAVKHNQRFEKVKKRWERYKVDGILSWLHFCEQAGVKDPLLSNNLNLTDQEQLLATASTPTERLAAISVLIEVRNQCYRFRELKGSMRLVPFLKLEENKRFGSMNPYKSDTKSPTGFVLAESFRQNRRSNTAEDLAVLTTLRKLYGLDTPMVQEKKKETKKIEMKWKITYDMSKMVIPPSYPQWASWAQVLAVKPRSGEKPLPCGFGLIEEHCGKIEAPFESTSYSKIERTIVTQDATIQPLDVCLVAGNNNIRLLTSPVQLTRLDKDTLEQSILWSLPLDDDDYEILFDREGKRVKGDTDQRIPVIKEYPEDIRLLYKRPIPRFMMHFCTKESDGSVFHFTPTNLKVLLQLHATLFETEYAQAEKDAAFGSHVDIVGLYGYYAQWLSKIELTYQRDTTKQLDVRYSARLTVWDSNEDPDILTFDYRVAEYLDAIGQRLNDVPASLGPFEYDMNGQDTKDWVNLNRVKLEALQNKKISVNELDVQEVTSHLIEGGGLAEFDQQNALGQLITGVIAETLHKWNSNKSTSGMGHNVDDDVKMAREATEHHRQMEDLLFSEDREKKVSEVLGKDDEKINKKEVQLFKRGIRQNDELERTGEASFATVPINDGDSYPLVDIRAVDFNLPVWEVLLTENQLQLKDLLGSDYNLRKLPDKDPNQLYMQQTGTLESILTQQAVLLLFARARTKLDVYDEKTTKPEWWLQKPLDEKERTVAVSAIPTTYNDAIDLFTLFAVTDEEEEEEEVKSGKDEKMDTLPDKKKKKKKIKTIPTNVADLAEAELNEIIRGMKTEVKDKIIENSKTRKFRDQMKIATANDISRFDLMEHLIENEVKVLHTSAYVGDADVKTSQDRDDIVINPKILEMISRTFRSFLQGWFAQYEKDLDYTVTWMFVKKQNEPKWGTEEDLKRFQEIEEHLKDNLSRTTPEQYKLHRSRYLLMIKNVYLYLLTVGKIHQTSRTYWALARHYQILCEYAAATAEPERKLKTVSEIQSKRNDDLWFAAKNYIIDVNAVNYPLVRDVSMQAINMKPPDIDGYIDQAEKAFRHHKKLHDNFVNAFQAGPVYAYIRNATFLLKDVTVCFTHLDADFELFWKLIRGIFKTRPARPIFEMRNQNVWKLTHGYEPFNFYYDIKTQREIQTGCIRNGLDQTRLYLMWAAASYYDLDIRSPGVPIDGSHFYKYEHADTARWKPEMAALADLDSIIQNFAYQYVRKTENHQYGRKTEDQPVGSSLFDKYNKKLYKPHFKYLKWLVKSRKELEARLRKTFDGKPLEEDETAMKHAVKWCKYLQKRVPVKHMELVNPELVGFKLESIVKEWITTVRPEEMQQADQTIPDWRQDSKQADFHKECIRFIQEIEQTLQAEYEKAMDEQEKHFNAGFKENKKSAAIQTRRILPYLLNGRLTLLPEKGKFIAPQFLQDRNIQNACQRVYRNEMEEKQYRETRMEDDKTEEKKIKKHPMQDTDDLLFSLNSKSVEAFLDKKHIEEFRKATDRRTQIEVVFMTVYKKLDRVFQEGENDRNDFFGEAVISKFDAARDNIEGELKANDIDAKLTIPANKKKKKKINTVADTDMPQDDSGTSMQTSGSFSIWKKDYV
jgi:hypothetical protein